MRIKNLKLILPLAFFILNFSLANAADRGPVVSMELRDVEIRDVMRALGQEHNLNIIVDDKVTGKVTVSLQKVPLWDAIDSILRSKGLTYIKEDNIIRVVTFTEVGREEEGLITRTFVVSFANPKELEGVIKKVLSKKGDLISDPRTNTLVVKDIPANMPRVEALIKTLDTQPPQVMIDAKIVEANKDFGQSLGIQWGGSYSKSGVTIKGDTGTDSFAINLPAALPEVTASPFGAIRFGNVASSLTLALKISAIEQSGEGKILSNPRILTANNKKATISTGTKIRIVTAAADTIIVTGGTTTTTTEEIEATLKLEVTPQITQDGYIMLNIVTKKDEFDFTRTIQGFPAIITREAKTDLMIKDGETIVIGGIFTKSDVSTERAIPWISKIPILGWLFKSKTETEAVRELLIFVTPKIKRDI
ncbi:MAG: type IV pilus secretin PilQ [Nitrospirae bacterium]|nr:type IV pilus secretin PilQ [Nitrospirota bacterium]